MKVLVKITKEVLAKTMLCSVDVSVDACFTQKDFDNKRGVGFNCAIGYAVRQLLPNAWTSNQYILIYKTFEQMNGQAEYSIILPEVASTFINEFDSCKYYPEERLNMPEISFEIDVPDKLIEEIGIGEAYKILSESKTLELA